MKPINNTFKMKKSKHEISMTLKATPEDAWSVIGKVSGVDQWLGPITACRVEGDKRYCTTENGEFSEDILEVDHEQMRLRYAIPAQNMLPVENILGEMKVDNEQGLAQVSWSWEFDTTEANEAEAKEMLTGIGTMGLNGIENLLSETASA